TERTPSSSRESAGSGSDSARFLRVSESANALGNPGQVGRQSPGDLSRNQLGHFVRVQLLECGLQQTGLLERFPDQERCKKQQGTRPPRISFGSGAVVGVTGEIGQDSRLPTVLPCNNSETGVRACKTPECEPFGVRTRQSPLEQWRGAFRGRRHIRGTR